ncbi:MAG: hypothetical protein JOZ07_14480 [Solirubrobacterales bacterium]|nr:hypothetical protein [Solirubrobacterales bacterium]
MATGSYRRTIIRGVGRAGALPIAGFAVHQLRYLLAYGSAASAMLQRQGHSYLHSVVPWMVLALGLAVGGLLSSLGRALSGRTTLPRLGLSLTGLWLSCSVCLIAIYCSQELLEGTFATGHPAGLAGVFGSGGWWAIPTALCVGLVLAAVLHGACRLVREVALRHRAGRAAGRRTRIDVPRPAPLALPRLAPLAAGWCDRGPPR